ncbi:NAD(P)/FAD-dependent oxidoreductase [Streptomyces sp. 8L]|uniref:NAD(P)/FAD-dependent oxidoreductase n=1 Tax=Streptomyces sp. 8L TaxID=2877242 RepID=UPI001CD3C409|nr:NAD(P)/FAD-dependent oxidoreductase [Streptomyces sp. 8L]MCA1221244.1 NAD(P)/FAD-dependent oxidoreductase [Streptomyces sp. 8L]
MNETGGGNRSGAGTRGYADGADSADDTDDADDMDGADRADIVVVGGGVAGVQAALVLGRARRRVVVVDGGHPRNERARAVHNLAGHEGTAPAELLERARSDAARYGVRFVSGTVTGARHEDAGDPARSGLRIAVDRGRAVFAAGALVLATGITEDLPDVPGLAALWGHDVVSCPYCHGWEAAGLPVAVVGSGPRAWRQLLLLRRFTDDLTLITDGPTGLEPAQSERLALLGITVCEDRVTRVVAEDGRLAGVEFADGRLVPYGALFAATARRQASPLPALLGCAVSGASVVTDTDGRTGVPGVWAAGTCADPSLTVAGAMGHATTTAIALNNALVDAETEEWAART